MFANIDNSPKGVFLFKTANTVQAQAAVVAKRAGHKIAMSDEEVLAITTAEEISRIVDEASAHVADVFLCLDERHKGVINSMGPSRCEIVGNARVDLLTRHKEIYRAEADAIRAKGPYILINSSFATINSVWGDFERAIKITSNTLGLTIEKARHLIRETAEFEYANRDATLDLLEWLRTQTTHRIVVRPHPAENPASWNDFEGIEIAAKTSPIPWIMGAEVMIHSNSTTGLECALVGTPCLNLTPIEHRFTRMYVTQDCNYTARSVDEAKAALTSFLADKSGPLAEPHSADFATDGAEKSARFIAEIAPEVAPLTQWGQLVRKDTQIEKFNISVQDFAARAMAICKSVGIDKINVLQLDNSCFLLSQ